MKTRFVFVVLTCVALTCASGYGDRPASDERRDQKGRPASPKAQRSGRRGPAVGKPPQQLPKRQARVASAGAMNPRIGSDGSLPSAKGSLIQNPTAGRYGPVRSPGPVGVAASPLSNVRHRSPNPAVIAGSAGLGNRNTAAIDGKQVYRRP